MLRAAKAKVAAGEIEVISIDPVVTSTHEYLGREHVKHIAVNPQTDVPLQLALAHTLYSENLYDKNFLANYCVGLSSSCRICWVRKTVSRKMPHGLKN
ncbi:molybdopterin-dependent oxidoreductase [Escherichia coli]|nr:molybdopterin-dependent oxidoreductase [Escherichia coli]